jgi:hypothetical protein
MCEHINRDSHDKYLTQQQDKRSKSVLSAQTRNLRVQIRNIRICQAELA